MDRDEWGIPGDLNVLLKTGMLSKIRNDDLVESNV